MTEQSEQTEPEPTTPREMTCLRRLYVMEDDAGGTWLAVEEATGETSATTEDSPVEGGSMSHRTALSGRGGSMSHRPDPDGGSMSHLGPGDKAEVEGDSQDQVTIVVTLESGDEPLRLQAYRVSRALLPTGEDPAAS